MNLKHISFFATVLISFPTWGADVSELLSGYHTISQELAHDQYVATRLLAETWQTPLKIWLGDSASSPHFENVEKMLKGAQDLATTTDEKEQRLAYALISEGLIPILRQEKALQVGLQLYYCPMAPTFRYWTQPKSESMANPYMGLKMLQCGSKRPW